MNIQFNGKTVIVTGAAGGLGSAMAELFAQCGAKVAVCDCKMADEVVKSIEEKGFEASAKDKAEVPMLQIMNEMLARGIEVLPVDIYKSEAKKFVIEDGRIRLPFSSLPGLGENAAQNIINARDEEPFFSVEDLQIRAKLSKAVIDILRTNGALDNIQETDQLTMKF